MKELRYQTSIEGIQEKVWHTLIDIDTYEKWAEAFSPNSTYQGVWRSHGEMLFWDPDMGGTVAVLDEFKPFERIAARHTHTVTKDGTWETTGEMTEKWIGTIEKYLLSEKEGVTTLKIVIQTDPAFASMFEQAWPQALENIKKLAEDD